MVLTKLLFIAVLAASLATAFTRGGRQERQTAAVLLAASLGSPLVQAHLFITVETGILAVDLVVFGFLLWVALTSDRFWPMWACAFQLVATVIHLARLADPTVWPLGYAAAEIFWAYPILGVLIVGTLFEHAPPR